MTIAEIHGKSTLSTSEDFLTADVFTAFRYLPAEPGLLGFLRAVAGLGDLLPSFDRFDAQIHFWPLGALLGREPDLLLELTFNGRLIHIVVEAKYYAGPGDKNGQELVLDDQTVSSGRQLVDQFLDLSHGYYAVFQDGIRDKQIMLKSQPTDRYLLFLTAHPVRPKTELAAVVNDYPEMADSIFWASWYKVFDYFQNLRPSLTQFPYDRILADICLLLKRKGFFTFHSFHPPFSFRQQNTEYVFWQDVHPEQLVFEGFTRPPQLDPLAAASVFWQGQSKDNKYD